MTENQNQDQEALAKAELQNWLFGRLSPDVLGSLSQAQKEALHQVVSGSLAGPPVNIRLNLPFLGHRYYITVFGGKEKRSHERQRHERHRYPLRTAANIFFAIGFAVVFYVIALLGLALFSAVIEV